MCIGMKLVWGFWGGWEIVCGRGLAWGWGRVDGGGYEEVAMLDGGIFGKCGLVGRCWEYLPCQRIASYTRSMKDRIST